MTLADAKKQPILRRFHELTVTPGWTFSENGPNEKDRQLLVEYNVVSEELLSIDPKYAFLSGPVILVDSELRQVPRGHP